MSRLSTKQRRSAERRRRVERSMAVDHRGRWSLLNDGVLHVPESVLRAQGWRFVPRRSGVPDLWRAP